MADADRRPAGWYADESMANTQRYWDGSSWTGHVAPAGTKHRHAATTEVVAGGVLKALFLVAAAVIGVGIAIIGVALLADEGTGTVVGVILAIGGLSALLIARKPSKRRRPWDWWELAIVTGLGTVVLIGLVGIQQDRQRDDEAGRIGCETYVKMYGSTDAC